MFTPPKRSIVPSLRTFFSSSSLPCRITPKKYSKKYSWAKDAQLYFLLYLQFFKADQHDLKGSQLCTEGKGTIQIQKMEGHFRLQGPVEHAQALRG